MKAIIKRFLKEEDGVTAVEYGLIAGLIAVALVTAMSTLTTGISGAFTYIASKLPSAHHPPCGPFPFFGVPGFFRNPPR